MRIACLAFGSLLLSAVWAAAPARACPGPEDAPWGGSPRGVSTLPPASALPALRAAPAPRRVYTSSSAYTSASPATPLLAPRATYTTTRTYTPARYQPARYPRRYYR